MILDAAWEVARDQGLGALTLRAVAERVGMRPPSLYSHVDSKEAVLDAMFGEAWAAYLEVVQAVVLPDSPREALRQLARTYVDFSTADLARHQLMDVRIIPDFTPSPESYAVPVAVMQHVSTALADLGVHPEEGDVDLFVAIVGGLVDAQWSNDPGGTRYTRLLDRAVDMYADHLGLPEEPR